MATLIIDASVAIKWVANEPDFASARALVGTESLAAPDFILLECANALWATARRKIISGAEATVGYAKIASAPIDLYGVAPLVAAAQAIALEIDRTVYDSLYLALALTLGAQLVTADENFARAAEAHPVYRALIQRLGA